MAQPVFEDHPLEDYFRQAGEVVEDMPGGIPDFRVEEPPLCLQQDSIAHKLSTFLSETAQVLNTLVSSSAFCSQENAFSERFKYDVISSSLLSNSIAAAPPSATRRTFTPDIPGRLSEDEGSDHSRSSSITDNGKPNAASELNTSWPWGVASIAILAISVEYYFLALFLGCVAFYLIYAARFQASRENTMNQTVDALNELISAGNVWDSAVNEAMSIVESDESRPSLYGMHSTFSTLRIALQSSLHTTQTQCDNVRQLLSALTSPPQLAQLSEMYAPASPVRPAFLPLESQSSRPLSDPMWRKRTTSLPSEAPTNKRATWNGSYVSLAQASNAAVATLKRKEKRRTDMSALYSPSRNSFSAPASPQPPKKLPDVQEETDDEQEEFNDASSELSDLKETEYFGMAALDMQRKRRSGGLEVFGLTPPPSYTTHNIQAPATAAQTTRSPRRKLSLSSPTKFTLSHSSRHPLSLSTLRLALHGALAAKRYACAHLLALRFEDEEDEIYWEDVRSIMALLTSTFSDASSRLMEALDEAEKKRMKDERPSTESSREASPTPELQLKKQLASRPARTMAEMVSFAPMPSHLSRFAAHVDAISSALNDARSHLEECVASLRATSDEEMASIPTEDSAALQTYDRLRKELGFALRECERGRERLLDIISPPSQHQEQEHDSSPPSISLLIQSESSDDLTLPQSSQSAELLTHSLGLEEMSQPLDDATEHLLLTTSSQHLPPPGIEQVFEAESSQVGIFTRERSRMSREDRIRLAKAKRESGIAFIANGARSSLDGSSLEEQRPLEKWGPGGEVVQELKDVIWKVGEKRRKMTEQPTPSSRQDVFDTSSTPTIVVESSRTSLDSDTSITEFPLFVPDSQTHNWTLELDHIVEISS
ncbi:hypothetical protein QCA50_011176 [Cerrena zonata]|uniref:Myosin-binding domain-containing protein n=1 Tax=Cerrena zonata TaxID=2478898 RepID=A0AAW0FX94_9APHY